MQINCHDCGCLVMEIKEGSHIRKGAIALCKTCGQYNGLIAADPMPRSRDNGSADEEGLDYLKKMFGMN